MRRQKVLLAIFLATAAAAPTATQAQFSPRGLFGTLTHPFREMLGRLGHRHHNSRETRAEHATRTTDASQFGDVGPAGWPSAYEDILGFTFWPSRYAEQMPAHGFDIIADALTNPGRGPEIARNTTGSAVQSDGNGNLAQSCSEPLHGTIDRPASQVETEIKLDDAQRATLDKLRMAVTQAVKTIKAQCSNFHALPPLDRLKATVQEIWTVRDAGVYIRAPLKDFYDSLSDEQKAKFTWKQSGDQPKPSAKPDNGAMAKQYQACAAPSQQAAERLLRQIEEDVHPSKTQNQAMQALHKTAGEMAKLLTAPCARPIPETPLARLDAANDQLSNLSYAATSMEIALDGFHAQLDDNQKAKFDSLGR